MLRQHRAHMVPQHQGGGTMQEGRTVTAVIQVEAMVVLQAFEEHAMRLVLGICFALEYDHIDPDAPKVAYQIFMQPQVQIGCAVWGTQLPCLALYISIQHQKL